MEENVVWHEHKISQKDREKILNQKSCLIWFTGLSGSGKSTIASALQEKLISNKKLCYILDGDNVRHGLNSDLGFSPEDREENIRRLGEVGKLFVDAGIVVITAFISPYKKDRQMARDKIDRFIEVYVKCDVEECEKRDPKGLYKKARSGEIKNFTGISAPYEEPENPEIVIESATETPERAAEKIFNYLETLK